MKRLLSIIASAALIFTSAPAMTSFAEDKTNDFKLHFKIENGEACLTGEWSDNVTELVIPETYEGKPVTSIDEKAFTGNENIVSCVIPDTVKSVGDLAFAACPNLKSISIGSGFSSLGNLSFANCNNLTSITVSKDNPDFTSINSCLYNKKGDTLRLYAGGSKAVVSDNTKTIGKWAFFERSDITSVTIPSSVTAIEDSVFSGCLSLKEITIPDSVTKLGKYCFMSCRALQSVSLGKSVTEIPEECFYCCTALNDISLSDNIKSIDDRAFYCCEDISGIYIPTTVKSIGEDAVGKKYISMGSYSINIPNFQIKGEKGSAAEKYAFDQNISFLTDDSQGDVNGDGKVDSVDASAVLAEYALLSAGKNGKLTEKQSKAADWNSDGNIDSVDASAILAEYARVQTL